MRRGVTIFAVLAGVLTGGMPPLFAQSKDSLIGKRVMVIRWNADLKVGSKTIGRTQLGSLIDVSKVNGDWLWVKQASGWIQRSNVVRADLAIAHFSSLINRKRNAESYHQRAVGYTALKQFDKALADLNAAISRDPRNVAAINDRGNVYRNLGQPKRAIADFDKVIANNVRHPAIYTNRGLAWHDTRDYDRALSNFNAAIKIDAKFAPAWEAAGSARQAKEEHPAAIRNFKEAIRLDPKFVRAYNNLAWIMSTCQHGKHLDGKQAVEYATKACKLTDYKDAGMLDTLAAALAEAGRFDDAVKHATAAMALATGRQRTEISKRLKIYEMKRPYREMAK